MLIIQILIVLFAVYAIMRTFFRFRRGGIGLSEVLLWTCFWLAGAVCVLYPGITQWFAGILGVGRGADAVFYLGLVGLSYAFFKVYLRIRQAEQQLTLLVRRLALKEAEHEEQPQRQ
jgi:hypothetical protein